MCNKIYKLSVNSSIKYRNLISITRVSTDRSPSHAWAGSTATPTPCTAKEAQPALCKKQREHLLCIFCIDSLDPSPTPPTPTKKEKEKEIPKHKKHPPLFSFPFFSLLHSHPYLFLQIQKQTIPISFQKKPFSFPR